MKKQYFDKKGLPVVVKENRALEANGEKWQLNVAGLATAQLAKTCGLYEFEPPQNTKANGKPTRPGKLLFDDKKGTCTREIVDLTAHEIEQQEEEKMFLEYEAEQAANLEIEKSQKFASWKATKKDKATKNNIKNKN